MNHIRSGILGIVLMLGIMPAFAIDIAQKPVFLNPPDPRVMLVMSRDHELSKKAYNDHSDLDGDGALETTYADTIDYYGYFDPKKCYTYSSGRFNPVAAATGTNSHHCSSQWSGNFLNWVSMTRMDVLRKTLYGGLRSTDNNGAALGDTVLERALLPNDVHAYSKVFAPAGGATDMAKYTPYSNAAMSFCNVTLGSGFSRSSTAEPIIQIATGNFPRWAMTEHPQCGTGSGDKPGSLAATFTVRVAVCVSGMLEDNCTQYGATNRKPTGLLQKYGEKEALARVQFGLLTGSYSKNKSGGVLRKNTSWLTNNATAADNEINPSTGQFINQTATSTGIINTINRIRISGWDYSSGKHQNSCNNPGITSFSDGQCVDWGNPLGEMYLETLRYFSGASGPMSAFDSNSNEQTHLPSLPKVTWTDPLPGNQWCALSNTVVLSTGLNSFDRDQLTGHGIAGLDATALTDQVGALEGVNGGTYLIGGNPTSDNQCTGKVLPNLSAASGICPEVPSLEGGYHIAGLAYANQTVDLRPSYQPNRNQRWGTTSTNPNADFAARQPMATFTVALAESLPKFEIPVAGGTITFLPACQANSTGTATAASSGWRVCSLTDLRITNLVTNGAGQPISGSLDAAWEDSTWGNDYDMDGVAQIDFCVGAACAPAIGPGQIKITAQATRAAAGHALRFGYTVTGTFAADGTYLDILRPGGANFTSLPAPASVTPPTSRTFAAGSSTAQLLENPLWYAAKYARSNWDTEINATGASGADGIPDNFFKVTNPAGLFSALGKVFERAANADASASAIASNSTRLDTTTHIYQAVFNSPAWTGELRAIPLGAGGVVSTASWEAGSLIPSSARTNIKTWNGQAWNVAANGGRDFLWGSLTSAQQTAIGSSAVFDYLRGDQSNEKPGGPYRKRTTLLGDIVNSDPHYVATESYGYDQPGSGLAAAEQAAYTVFRTGATGVTKVTRKKMLYVGANDGMLHAFNAASTTALGGGTEMFAYVPNAVIPNLYKLADPDYQHVFYVDGSANSGDAYLNSQWKTVLLGTLGAGGKAVFALDVTNPDSFDSTKVMWEFTDPDLGHIMGRAHVARMNNGHWYAVFGNGYNSNGAAAVLFLVPLDRTLGLPVVKIDTGVGSDNGLSEPALLDEDGDRIIDAIYAGDLKGNLWKFDVSASNTNSWGSAYKSGSTPNPLFTATDASSNPQPITGALEIGAPPSGAGDYMIYFGTGKYLGNTDIGDKSVQTAYGILDSGTKITTGRSALQSQNFVYEGVRTATDSSQIRVASDNAVAYTGTGAKRGWYLDLLSPNTPAALGERIVSVPLLRHGRVILTSIVPSDAPCDQGGYSWITELDALTGARLAYSVFDYNGDGTFDASDYAAWTAAGLPPSNPVSSKKLDSEGLMKSPTVISAAEVEYKVGSGTAGGIVVVAEKGTTGSPRTSWRQIFAP
ncbi:MAG: PilC/PilY family type IV pilus protein [Thiobacillus sp.]|nr:PilC/PilY family type IV pilus protein [Thiobacillus sp.]